MKIFGFDIKVTRKRVYEAAAKGSRRTKGFRLASSTGPNREVGLALVTLRNRSRHMSRNNGWSKRAVEAVVKHTVGSGIQPAPMGALAQTKFVKKLWSEWANSTCCDWYGKTNFYGLQELAMRAIVEGGEVLCVKRWSTDGHPAIPLKLELLEGDCLDHSRDGVNDMGVSRMGVQFSKAGELLGYWIFDYHPGDGMTLFGTSVESRFFPKSEILHCFELLRIGQVRGLPFGVAGFMKLADFSDYEDAQLLKQKYAAAVTALVTPMEDSADKKNNALEYIESGTIEYLNPGDTITFPESPSVSDYENYSARILQGIASAYGITYEMLTMDYSRVNFTSGRMAKIDVSLNFESWQYKMLVPQFCHPVWDWFTDACLITGALEAKINADWTAPRVQQLDPVKETSAQVDKIKAGLATLSETIRETGREPEEFFEEYKQDVDRIKELGILLSSIVPPADAVGREPIVKGIVE
jgi:lambda family phage portal protein